MPINCDRSCPLCYSNMRGRSNYKHHRGYRPPRGAARDWRCTTLKRPQGGDSAASREPLAAIVPGVEGEFPSLVQFCTDPIYDDGKPRETGTFMVCVGEGRWRILLRERSLRLEAWLSGETLCEALQAAEGALRAGLVAWRKAKEWKRN